MSDLDVLRENIIQAAREARDAYKSWGKHTDIKLNRAENNLIACVNALDATLKPDPWQLLQDVIHWVDGMQGVSHHVLESKLKAALLWRKDNPDA